MNYEQKYNEVLQKAKEEYIRLGELGNESMKRSFEIIFPELRESEDERIRTRLSEYFRGFLEGNEHCYKDGGYVKWEGLDVKSILDWLEKQKEQKPTERSEEDRRVTLACRRACENGYEQAEKDLALTWEDIRLICEIDEDMRCHSDWPLRGQEVYYEEVLRRFREMKNK